MKKSVVEEIIKTEISYQLGTEWMVTWKRRMVEKELIDEEEANMIFSNIGDINNISKTFLSFCRTKFDTWGPKSTIGKYVT